MKKLLLIISALTLSVIFISCAISRKQSVYVTDFRPYTNSGFIITPATTGFNYLPIANISVVISEGRGQQSSNMSDNYFDENTGTIITKKEYIALYGISVFQKDYGDPNNNSDVLSALVDEAKKLGANGILGFSGHTNWDSQKGCYVHYAEGFAVKIQ